MSKNRRTFSAAFKSKVILEALKEKETLEVLAKRFELLPTQISAWKAEATKNISAVFSKGKPEKKVGNEIPIEKLYEKIGQLKIENDFLKKSFINAC